VRLSRRRALLAPVALSLEALLSPGLVAAAEAPLVVVQPLGTAPSGPDVAAVVAAIRAFFAVRVAVKDVVRLPRAAFYAPRSRYRAEKLLDALAATVPDGARVSLGLTTVDISTTKGPHHDWGVLGLATLDGRSAVLSSFRCHRGARSAAHARERFAKTAVHELGHSFGLEHCATPGCLMHDGEGSVLTTDAEWDFCEGTRARLRAVGVLLPDARSPFVR
jgi:archaemetzincin